MKPRALQALSPAACALPLLCTIVAALPFDAALSQTPVAFCARISSSFNGDGGSLFFHRSWGTQQREMAEMTDKITPGKCLLHILLSKGDNKDANEKSFRLHRIKREGLDNFSHNERLHWASAAHLHRQHILNVISEYPLEYPRCICFYTLPISLEEC